MSEQDNTRRAPENYVATARAFCFDLAATAFLFVSASVMAGRVWRFPFDDEIATLLHIETDAARELIENFPATTDVHPPFSYLMFYGLRQLGFSDAAMRFVSLLLIFLALALCQILVLTWLSPRAEAGKPAPPTRRRGRLLLSLLDIQLRDERGGGRILPWRGPFRFDEYAWLLRWQ